MKRIILPILVAFVMTIIFLFSNQKASISSEISNSFIDKTIIKLVGCFDSDISDDKEEITALFTRPIRKLAHFTIYFLLGALVFFTFKAYDIDKNILLYSVLFCILYALSDEVHQLFVLGRSGSLLDVLLDSFASFLAIFIFNKAKKPNVV